MRSVLLLLFVFSGYFAKAQYYTDVKNVFVAFGGSTYKFSQENVSHTLIEGGIEGVALSIGNKPVRTFGAEVMFGSTILKHDGNNIITIGVKAGKTSFEEKSKVFDIVDFTHEVDVTEYGGFAHFHFFRLLNSYETNVWSVYFPIEYLYTTVESKFHLQGEFNHPELQDDNNLIRQFDSNGGSYGFGIGAEFYVSNHWNFNVHYIDYKDFIDSGRINLSARYTF